MKPTNAGVLLAVMCAGACCVSWPVLDAAPAGMTRAAIAEAIAYGETHAPEPYLLRHIGGEANPIVVGAVYTPFLRVAFLSHAAFERGSRLELADVPPTALEPHAYMAFRWYCCDPAEEPGLAGVKPQVRMLPNPARSIEKLDRDMSPFRTVRTGVRPVWMTHGPAVLSSFGAAPPFDDIAMVAAFPLESLTALRTFVIYKWLVVREDEDAALLGSSAFRYGVVRGADAARWR